MKKKKKKFAYTYKDKVNRAYKVHQKSKPAKTSAGEQKAKVQKQKKE